MRTVGVEELISDTCVELDIAVVDVVLHTAIGDVIVGRVALVVESIQNSGLYICLPLLLVAKVEGKINT